MTADFQLLESILWRPGRGFTLLDGHWRRLRRGAAAFGFVPVPSIAALRAALAAAVSASGLTSAAKLRLLVDAEGRMTVSVAPLPVAPAVPWRIAPARNPIDGGNPFVRHKTTRRTVYEQARAQQPDGDDVLLWNRRGQVTETTIANVLFDFGDGEWITPAVDCGLLPGVYREHLLRGRSAQTGAPRLREAVVPLDAVLRRRPAMILVNSVRGRIPAVLAFKKK